MNNKYQVTAIPNVVQTLNLEPPDWYDENYE